MISLSHMHTPALPLRDNVDGRMWRQQADELISVISSTARLYRTPALLPAPNTCTARGVSVNNGNEMATAAAASVNNQSDQQYGEPGRPDVR